MFRDQWLARDKQEQLVRDADQMRLHRLAAAPQHKPAKPPWRRVLDRRMK